MVWPFLALICAIVAFKNPTIGLVFMVQLAIIRIIAEFTGSDAYLLFFVAYSISAVIITLLVDIVSGALFAAISLVYLAMHFGLFPALPNQAITEVLFVAGIGHGFFTTPDRGILGSVYGFGFGSTVVHMAESAKSHIKVLWKVH